MRVVSEETLALFRGDRCEACGRTARCHAAHVYARGMGGGGRLDVPINLVSLCPPCHDAHHHGRAPTRHDLVCLVARRYGQLPDVIEARLFLMRRAPKDTEPCHVCETVGVLNCLPNRWRLPPVPCGVCHGGGILDSNGNAWAEGPRTFSGGGT